MFFSMDFKAGMGDLAGDFEVKNTALLKMCEDTGGFHCDLLHDGFRDAMQNGKAWVVVAWYMKVVNRPKYGDTITVTTWVKEISKVSCTHEFELTNADGVCAKVTSKWVHMDLNERKFLWLLPEKIAAYECEDKMIFDEPVKFKSMIKHDYESVTQYEVLKKDADILGHMHNLNYCEYAAMALPEDKRREYENLMIVFKNELPVGEKFACGYFQKDGKETVTLFQDKKTNAIVQMW